MTLVDVVGPLDANFAWNGRSLYDDDDLGPETPVPYELRGAAAVVRSGNAGRYWFLRDPLGLNKLFWARSRGGSITVSARPCRLVARGIRFGDIKALPRGCVAELQPDGRAREYSFVPADWSARASRANSDPDRVAHAIRAKLSRYLEAIAAAHPAAEFYVCLSGGLDSSGIAALACQHLRNVVAVSFDLHRPSGKASDDRRVAQRLARDFGIDLLDATVRPEDLLDKLDTVLVEGIDWRDFNVHTALVNAALAEAIAGAGTGPAAHKVVLTGDLANEFLADYHEEKYKGAVYYKLPRLGAAARRAHLVAGLDTSHREIGVFAAWNLPVIQPYAVAVDDYMRLPEDFLEDDQGKRRLCRAIFGREVPEYIYQRTKVRAQIGSPDAGEGVLAMCVDRGIDGAYLQRRFAVLHGLSDASEASRFIFAGHYPTGFPSLSEERIG